MADSLVQHGIVRAIADDNGDKVDGFVKVEVTGGTAVWDVNSQSPSDPAVLTLTAPGGGGLATLAVTDINSPTELNSEAGTAAGDLILVYESAVFDRFTLYAFDPLFVSETIPYVMEADTAGQWIAIGGVYNYYHQGQDILLLNVADIEDPVELESRTGAALGDMVVCYQASGTQARFRLYIAGTSSIATTFTPFQYKVTSENMYWRQIASNRQVDGPNGATDGYLAAFDGVSGRLLKQVAPSSIPASGPAGGDLSGTYPNPTVTTGAISPAKMEAGTLGQVIDFGGTAGAAQRTDSPRIGGESQVFADPFTAINNRFVLDDSAGTGLDVLATSAPAPGTSNALGYLDLDTSLVGGLARDGDVYLWVPISAEALRLGRAVRITGWGGTITKTDGDASFLSAAAVYAFVPDVDAELGTPDVYASDTTGWLTGSSPETLSITGALTPATADPGLLWLRLTFTCDAADIARPVGFRICMDSLYLTFDTI